MSTTMTTSSNSRSMPPRKDGRQGPLSPEMWAQKVATRRAHIERDAPRVAKQFFALLRLALGQGKICFEPDGRTDQAWDEVRRTFDFVHLGLEGKLVGWVGLKVTRVDVEWAMEVVRTAALALSPAHPLAGMRSRTMSTLLVQAGFLEWWPAADARYRKAALQRQVRVGGRSVRRTVWEFDTKVLLKKLCPEALQPPGKRPAPAPAFTPVPEPDPEPEFLHEGSTPEFVMTPSATVRGIFVPGEGWTGIECLKGIHAEIGALISRAQDDVRVESILGFCRHLMERRPMGRDEVVRELLETIQALMKDEG